MKNQTNLSKEPTSEVMSGNEFSGINSKNFSSETKAAILVAMYPEADDALFQINFPAFDRILNQASYWI